ncbi:MAG: hypothetical protein QOG85_149 [Gaiellaceae bacterium]|nr:hypothetical protein [Gaiellaceae bacterium]
MSAVVPYDRLVRFAVVQRRLGGLVRDLGDIEDRLGGWITEQLLGARLTDEYADAVYDEFQATVDARLGAHGDA